MPSGSDWFLHVGFRLISNRNKLTIFLLQQIHNQSENSDKQPEKKKISSIIHISKKSVFLPRKTSHFSSVGRATHS